MSQLYLERKRSGLYDPDEAVREKAIQKDAKLNQQRIKERTSAEGETEAGTVNPK